MRDIDKYESAYNESSFEEVRVKIRKKYIIEILRRYHSKQVLEIGCGVEAIFNTWSGFSEYTVAEPGTEFYEKALADSKKNKRHDSISCYNVYVENFSTKKSFDFIILSCLLHEVENPDEIMRRIHDLCNSETDVFILVPNAKSLHRLWAFEMGLIKDTHEVSDLGKILQQYRVYDMDILENYLGDMGFIACEKGGVGIQLFSNTQIKELRNVNFLTDRMIKGLNKMNRYIPEFAAEIYIVCKLKS